MKGIFSIAIIFILSANSSFAQNFDFGKKPDFKRAIFSNEERKYQK